MTLVEDAFRTVVDQFKDPLAFLRELVQNSLDAGSTIIDVDVRIDGELITFEVQDSGEGMDRAIIEGKLLRMFASDKEGDATKIGKFGIGFKSVFAVRPETVVVDTARGSETWRVVIEPDGTWQLFSLDEPLEGTRIRVLKREPNAAQGPRWVADSLATVRRWCRYADAEIRFAGKSIREPFALDAPVVVRVPLPAPRDEILVGLGSTEDAPWGFYNKGLTLLEGAGPFPGLPSWVSFRVRCGALEHTLTRDNVIRNDAYERVMAQIAEAAAGPLIEAALDALESDAPTRDAIARALAAPAAAGVLSRPAARSRRAALRDFRGRRVRIDDALKARKKERAVRVASVSALALAAERDERLVLWTPPLSGDDALVDALLGVDLALHETHVAVEPAGDKEQWQAAPLTHATGELLRELGLNLDVVVGRLDDPGGFLSDTPAVAARDLSRPLARDSLLSFPEASNRKSGTLALLLGAEPVTRALQLATTDAWLAAFLLLRLLRVSDGDLDAERLAAAAWRRRTGATP